MSEEQLKPRTRPATCGTHGPYESENPIGNIWLGCQRCEAEEERQRKALEASREARRGDVKAQIRIDLAGIPERFRGKGLDSYNPVNDQARNALRLAKAYATGTAPQKNLLLLGTVGTGKTHLACGVVMHMAGERALKPLYTTVQQAVRRVKETWSRTARETEAQAIAAFVVPDVLVLDEVGIQFGSDTERNIIFEIVNGRYEKGKATIVVSNLMIDEIRGFLGERVVDRLKEDGAAVIAMTWESYRR